MKKGKSYDTMFRDFSILDISKILYQTGSDFAEKMDKEDPLRSFRKHFYFPKNESGEEKIYLCGNSLGLLSLESEKDILEKLESWKKRAVKGHFEGEEAWVNLHLSMKDSMAKMVGAHSAEVSLMNTLTVNLHLMLSSFYQPKGQKTKIIVEENIFPSDKYAIESQIHWHGLKPKEEIIIVPNDLHSGLFSEGKLKEILVENEGEIALILLGGVNYYTGEWLNIEKITSIASEHNIKIGWDLAHAVGNVPLNLHESNCDFAVWCTYKYLNGGPGSIAGVFIHEKHHGNEDLPILKGWWGHDITKRFKMRDDFIPMPGVEAWQISCQPILSLAPIKSSLELFNQAGMKALRNKSILLTGYLEFLIKEARLKDVQIITPNLQSRRGCQLSLKISNSDKSIYDKLISEGIVVDWREPGVVRVAPTPLYNNYSDIYRFVKILEESLKA